MSGQLSGQLSGHPGAKLIADLSATAAMIDSR